MSYRLGSLSAFEMTGTIFVISTVGEICRICVVKDVDGVFPRLGISLSLFEMTGKS